MILLYVVGYIAMILLTVVILSFIFRANSDDEHMWLAVGAIFWPITLSFIILTAGLFFPARWIGRVADRLHKTGEELAERQRRSRSGD